MKNLSIYFSDDDEYAEYACKSNGMRPDVLVAIDGKFFHPMIYDIFTLTQEYNESLNMGKLYEILNNIVLVKEVTKNNIIEIILHLSKKGYFDKVKPVELIEEFYGSFDLFPKLINLEGWIKIYETTI